MGLRPLAHGVYANFGKLLTLLNRTVEQLMLQMHATQAFLLYSAFVIAFSGVVI